MITSVDTDHTSDKEQTGLGVHYLLSPVYQNIEGINMYTVIFIHWDAGILFFSVC